MYQLRPYQRVAVDKVYNHLREKSNNPVVVLPTGSGKTIVMARIVEDSVYTWKGRVLILAHVKELLEQTRDKIINLCPMIDIGIYSAGLKRRDVNNAVVVAGIQSIYKRAFDIGSFDLIMVDEAHRIPADGEGRYRTFLSEALLVNPKVRVIGLTATPYRMKSGLICTPEGILNEVCCDVRIKDLIADGYLCNLVSKRGTKIANTDGLPMQHGEFAGKAVHAVMNKDELVEAACEDITRHTGTRKKVLVFASNVEHGQHIVKVLKEQRKVAVGSVFGDTLAFDRKQTLEEFATGKIKYLVNVNVLTEGFDATDIDCVALVRPTASPGLYYQMVGRGLRTHEGKENCLILDFGNNVVRHGPIDDIFIKEKKSSGGGAAPQKTCPTCQTILPSSVMLCTECGHDFTKDTYTHDPYAAETSVLSEERIDETVEVKEVSYWVHQKKGWVEGDPVTMRVDYRIGFNVYQSEWLCFDHGGIALFKAEEWWKRRTTAPVPMNVKDAVAMASNGALVEPEALIIKKQGSNARWGEISAYKLGPAKCYSEPGWGDLEETEQTGKILPVYTDDDLPF